MTFPNWKAAPHQTRNAKQATRERKLISARELGDDFHPNRAQRREYIKVNQTRQGRLNIVGFGRWRRHNESTDESWARQTAIDPVAPRRERRPAAIAFAKTTRKLRRQQERAQ